jgi:putative ABC transport system permease protein
VIARLAPGVSHAEAEAALAAFDRERGAPEREATTPRLTGLQETLTGDIRPTLLLLAISVGLVLVVTTANVAGLLLARMTRRQPELVVRRALGASRWRLFQLMALDAASYAAVAGVAGAALSVLILRAVSVYSSGLGGLATASDIDGRMLLIAISVSALSALLFGLAPGLAVSAQPAAQALRGGVTTTRGRGWRWARHGLVVGQVACALVLLTVTTATIATMSRLAAVDLAFDGRGVLGLDVTLPTTAYEGPERASLFIDDAVSRLRNLPGVSSAGATGALPGDPSTGIGVHIGVPGEARPTDAPPRFASFLSATPGYFEAMGVRIVQGRAFTHDDRRGTPRVAVISESAARLLWPDGRSAVGLEIESGFRAMTRYEVVGVVPDVLLDGPEAMARRAHLYLPIAQHPPFGNVSFAVKSAGDPLATASAVRAAIAGVDSSLPVYNLRSMADVASGFLAAHRVAMAVMGAFAVLTLLLAGVGLYGVLAQLIEQQTREIGIRVALGADPRRVRRGVVAFAVRLASVGVLAGAAGSSLAATLVASYVPRLDAIAWPTVAVHAGVILVVALVASWVPARRASTIDPIVALRE